MPFSGPEAELFESTTAKKVGTVISGGGSLSNLWVEQAQAPHGGSVIIAA
jgi:hypothetical protein